MFLFPLTERMISFIDITVLAQTKLKDMCMLNGKLRLRLSTAYVHPTMLCQRIHPLNVVLAFSIVCELFDA